MRRRASPPLGLEYGFAIRHDEDTCERRTAEIVSDLLELQREVSKVFELIGAREVIHYLEVVLRSARSHTVMR